jgi:hypothetical protein
MFWLLSRAARAGTVVTLIAFVLGAGIIVGHRAFPTTGPYADRAYNWVTATWEPVPPKPLAPPPSTPKR